MVTISNVAQQLLDENNYDTTDIHATAATAKTRVEYLVDNAIDYINMKAGTSIVDLSGSAGSKSLVATEDEIVVIKALSALLIRAYLDKGPNVNVGGVSAIGVMSDPHFGLMTKMLDDSINSLRELPIVIKNDPLPTE